jgi:hypothetical protein
VLLYLELRFKHLRKRNRPAALMAKRVSHVRLRAAVSFVSETKAETMKRTHLLAAIIGAAIPFAAVLAEDTTKSETADQKNEQNSCCMGMSGMSMGKTTEMGMGNMISNWKDQDAELDKLVADMNSAPSDKKSDAIAAVVTKLVEQRKAMHEGMQKMMTAGGKEMMNMRSMMMMMRMMMQGGQEGQGESDHSQHH